jgi:hypothetical protein
MIWRRNNGPCKRTFRWSSIIWIVQRLISSLSVLKRRNIRLKGAIHSQLNCAILLCDVIPDGKKWVKCAVLIGNRAGLRTVPSSRLSNTELCSSLRESHSFLSLPADNKMASPQGTSVSSNSFSKWASHDIFHFKYHFLLHILRVLFFF